MDRVLEGQACAPNLGARARRRRGRAGAFLLAAGLAAGALAVFDGLPWGTALVPAVLVASGWTGIRQARRGL